MRDRNHFEDPVVHPAKAVVRLALIGYRCTGKTSLAQILAQQWGWRAVDLDKVLRERALKDIADLVREQGWHSFRMIEAELLREFSKHERVVVATGGGVIETPECRETLKKDFYTVWLTADIHTILQRMSKDANTAAQRPPLTDKTPEEEVRTLLEHRRPWYRECSNLKLSTDRMSPSRLAAEIEKAMHRGDKEEFPIRIQ